jgi:hypothetical protein
MTTSSGPGDKPIPAPTPQPAERSACLPPETIEQFGLWIDAQLAVLERQQERFVRLRKPTDRTGR